MTEVTNDLIYEILKGLQADSAATRTEIREIKGELNAMRGHLLPIQQDIHLIYGALEELTQPLDRVEQRLELSPAE